MNPAPVVTVIRPTLSPEERERRKQEAKKALAAFFTALHMRREKKA